MSSSWLLKREMSFSGKTHEECKASKEERREEGLKLWNNCPICEESGFFCDVGRHPIAKVLEEQKLLRLQEQRAARTAGRF